jgi:hypothetical protein
MEMPRDPVAGQSFDLFERARFLEKSASGPARSSVARIAKQTDRQRPQIVALLRPVVASSFAGDVSGSDF